MKTLCPTCPIQPLPTTSSFFFNDTATTEIYTLSLHDALPIWALPSSWRTLPTVPSSTAPPRALRSEEHTSELQSHLNLVCRLLLEKKSEGGISRLPMESSKGRSGGLQKVLQV